MDKQVECARLAMMLSWAPICDLDIMLRLGVPDAVEGDTVWLFPGYYEKAGSSRTWVHELDFDPWEDANDDVRILEHFRYGNSSILSDYKDALYHETKGHGTHNVWDYRKGKFANAAINLLNRPKM